jgi:hypothetical protein
MRKLHRSIGLALAAAALIGLSCVKPGYAIPHATAAANAQNQALLIASGTLIRIAMLSKVSSAHNKKGDTFYYKVLDDVKAGDRIAISAGTIGKGSVSEARPAHGGRADGSLHLQFDPLLLTDRTEVYLAITHESAVADENLHNGMGATVEQIADVVVPGFFLVDFLRKGQDVTLAAGAAFHVAVTEDSFLTP